MNDGNSYNYGKNSLNSTGQGGYFDDNPEIKTNKNIEALNRLLNEADYGDDTFHEFTLNNQAMENESLGYDDSKSESSFKDRPTTFDETEDPLEKTMEIKDVNLQEMKELQAQLHALYDEPNDGEKTASEGQSQSKGKSLVKATKQGIAFSNGSMTRTFLDCAILCFITASMGYGMFMYIMTHI